MKGSITQERLLNVFSSVRRRLKHLYRPTFRIRRRRFPAQLSPNLYRALSFANSHACSNTTVRMTVSLLQSTSNLNTTIIRYLHDQQLQSLVVGHTGLADGCLLPASLTELTGFMPVGIIRSFADDLHNTVSERRISRKSRTFDLFHLPNSLVQNVSLPQREIVFTGTSNSPCKLRKGNLASVTDLEQEGHLHLPARVGLVSEGRSELKAL